MKLHFTASTHDASQAMLAQYTKTYGQARLEDADVIVVLGGDGQMLHSLRDAIAFQKPVFGINCGHIGFLLNEQNEADLLARIEMAETVQINPLRLVAHSTDGTQEALAINEVSMLRQTHNAAHLAIKVNGKLQLPELVCDGVMVATPAGSTAYNLSAHGPVIPIGAELLALTPISAFRPRRWRGALLPANSQVEIEVLQADFRPVSASADSREFRAVERIEISRASDITLDLMFDSGASLYDRSIQEQFNY
ncbi:MAG: NAD kinase [Candidatus Puniceispirillaceae bacterium]